ncbi:hypothetical protein A2Z22_03995 [Candidatus Woesebacteria bacterium RBG_16_34_12]|uniref:methionyl-tRNA formyltransferase n=1 Tax=Candidatus Woesebacteria bacterium RBG_16_34_12 TaxID=1802480 RepID=A0A1F7X9E5_9BACT|nr:MAG: hypothetical protein A2Z22_03995 [Candidatus Woesebacteria bacterium RBG_16_34_12]
MKLVFFGTPEYALPVLESLNKTFRTKMGGLPIAAVVTQNPKTVGRKQTLEYSPVDQWAHKKKVPIYYDPENIIRDNISADLGVIASYGKIISKQVITHFPYGILNIHFSLLPEFRGAAPVEAAIVTGKKEIGVTIFKIDDKLDHGLIISQFKEEIRDDDNSQMLKIRLFQRSAEVLTTLIPAYLRGIITPRKQDEKKASFTYQIKKDDAFIPPEYLDFVLGSDPCTRLKSKNKGLTLEWKIPFIKDYSLVPSANSLEHFIRAMYPWPIAWTQIQLNPKLKTKNLKRLKILKAHIEQDLSLKSSVLCLDSVQLEGKFPVSWKQFFEGYPEAKFI